MSAIVPLLGLFTSLQLWQNWGEQQGLESHGKEKEAVPKCFYKEELHQGNLTHTHTHKMVRVCVSRSVISDSLQPHGLYSPWNSPGQDTGVGSLSLLQGIFPTQGSNHGLCSPWNSPGQNTGVGSLSLLQEVFPTQGLNPGLPYCRKILNQLSYKPQGGEFRLKFYQEPMVFGTLPSSL